MVAWTSFATDTPTRGLVVRRGEKLRGRAGVVRAYRNFFVTADTPECEWRSEFTRAVEVGNAEDRRARAEQARWQPPAIPDDRAVEVMHAFRIGLITYAEGTRFDRDDELVGEHPEFFGTLRRPIVG